MGRSRTDALIPQARSPDHGWSRLVRRAVAPLPTGLVAIPLVARRLRRRLVRRRRTVAWPLAGLARRPAGTAALSVPVVSPARTGREPLRRDSARDDATRRTARAVPRRQTVSG